VLWAEQGIYRVSTDISEIESEIIETPPEDVPVEETKPRRGGSALAFLAFVFALAALGGTAWMWWQDQTASDESDAKVFSEISRLESADSELSLKLKQLRDEMDSLPSVDSSADVAALQRRMESGIAEADRLEQSLNEQLTLSRSLQAAAEAMQGRLLAAETALTGMASRELDAGGELDLAEVDYLLRLATERLKLFSDPVAADEVLDLADMHLAAMDNPIYLGVRQDIAVARRELAAVTFPDYFAISNELDEIQTGIAALPFRGEIAAAAEQEPATEAGWWDKVKSVFSNLVTIRRSTNEENERISLEDKDYIRQRLWLQLEIAHLSLMRRDQKAFRDSLARVEETLTTWFEAGSSQFQSTRGKLESLAELEVQLDVPDISAPWATLQTIRAGRVRPAAAAPAEIPPLKDPAGSESPPVEAPDGDAQR
jgi:uroporphyrin-3 C-methyltransferase